MNNEIQKAIQNVIIYGENKRDVNKENLISARSILLAEKERQLEKQRDIGTIVQQLKKDMYFLSDIVFYHNIGDFQNKSIILWLKFDGNYEPRYGDKSNCLMLVYKDDNLDFLYSAGLKEPIQNIILNKHKDKFIKLAKYGIKKHFNVDPIMSTISNNFKIYSFDDVFRIESNSDKKFKLYYLHHEEMQKNGFETQDGHFYITTNIYNLKQLFSYKKNFKSENKITTFLNNIMVKEDDVPLYIKKKILK